MRGTQAKRTESLSQWGMVMGNPKRFKIKPLTPFKFYGEEAPRKISKNPKQVLEPLLGEIDIWRHGRHAGLVMICNGG